MEDGREDGGKGGVEGGKGDEGADYVEDEVFGWHCDVYDLFFSLQSG